MEVKGTKPKGRLRTTWKDGIKEDMKKFDLSWEDVQSWRNGEGK